MKYFFIFIFALSLQNSFCQNNQLWKGYFSYNTIIDITQSENTFFAASQNALFSRSNLTNEIKTTNTIDGLPSQSISSVYYSTTFNKTLIGYENGLMIVIQPDGTIITVVDILNKQIPPNIKKINHFNEVDGMVYIACDFGIVQYNLSTLQFGDTYFIGSITSEIVVAQTAILNGYIYAATAAEGIKRAEITNPNLIDANQWISVASGNFSNIVTFQDNLFAIATSGQIVRSTDGVGFFNFGTPLSPTAVDMRTTDTELLITTPDTVSIYNEQFALQIRVDNYLIPEIFAQFTCATILNNTLYIGSRRHGVITTALDNPTTFNFISPSGPIKNNIFSINSTTNNLWAVYGGYTVDYDPNPLQFFGISKFNSENGWLNIPYEALNTPNLVRVTVNPANENQIFVSSYFSGLLKFENDVLVTTLNHTNTGSNGLEITSPDNPDIRLEQSAYDKAGNLWLTNGLVPKALKVLRANGQWQSYGFESILQNVRNSRFGKLVVDKNNTKWMATSSDGLIGFNEAVNPQFKIITEGPDEGNLPSPSIQAIAIDTRNQLWIGTRKGLRILSSVDRFTAEEDLTTNAIIIEEEGVGAELLDEQFITDIMVDGANNKWVGTLDAGVFLFSSNGQETLQQFTTSNSPLPSNAINDIDINTTTGEVFFATTGGLVSFKGNAIKPSDNLQNVIVYPNPVRPEFEGTVKIAGLLNKANIKITDIEGNLVYETISIGGTIEWDTKAFGKYKVASGVYMIFITSDDGLETKVKKVMIIR